MTIENDDSLNSISKTIAKAIFSKLKELHTALPAEIVDYDADSQLASVQPTIKRIFTSTDDSGTFLKPSDLPVLINVPVMFQRGGGYSLTFPVKKGDECLLIFCERAISDWYLNGGVSTPTTKRFHSLNDAVAIVGLSSQPNIIPDCSADDVQLKKDDGTVHITIKENDDIDFVTPQKVNVTADSLNLTGDLNVDGDCDITGVATAPTVQAASSLTVAGTEMNGHTHGSGGLVRPNGPVTGNTGGPN